MLGIPFVATDFEDWRQRVDSGSEGPAGVFIGPEESAEVAARTVLDLVKSKERSLRASEAGVDYVVTQYSWQAAGAPVLFELYDRIIKATRNKVLRRP